jgi:glutamyl/glutaminyl-tRNA synthetase
MNLGSNLTGSSEPELELNELIRKFDIKSYGKASPNFNQHDLEKLNLENLRILDSEKIIEFFEKIFCKENLKFNSKYWEIYKNNLEEVQDILFWQKLLELNSSDYINFLKSIENDLEKYDEFLGKKENQLILRSALKILKNDSSLKSSFEKEEEKTWSSLAEQILELDEIKDHGISKKNIFLCLRFFLTGKNFGPCMNSLIKFFGFEKIVGVFEAFLN